MKIRAENTIPITDRIEQLIEGIPGWTPIDELLSLYLLALFVGELEGDYVEIGSWAGRSAVVLGLAARQVKNGHVQCIDLFPEKDDWRQNEDGSYSFSVDVNGVKYDGYADQTVWKEPFEKDIVPIYEKYDGIKDLFGESVRKAGMQGIVDSYRGDCRAFFSEASEEYKCRLVFIDGDHSYDAVRRDIEIVQDRLVPGGIICFDDAHTMYDGVDRAISDCILNNPRFGYAQQITRKFFAAVKLS